MTVALPSALRDLVESGTPAYLATVNADSSPQVTMIWIGLDGDDLISVHMRHNQKLRNIERDPRVVLSFGPPHVRSDWLSPHVVVHATAAVGPLIAVGAVIARMATAYIGDGAEFPESQTGHLVRYSVDRIGGIGPWAPKAD